MSEQMQRGEELFDKLSKDKKRRRNKIIRTVVILIAVIAVILVAAVILLRKNVEARFASAAAEVQEYTVSTGTIHTIVTGSGILTEEDVETIDVPAGVEITELVAEAGDTVSEGDLIATVDMATVMTTLSSLQEQLDDLDEQISDAKGDEVSSYIRAGVTGRLKRIFGEKGMDVSLCMAENGALAVISLDGYMAVDLETDKLSKGDEVTVTRPDGSGITGTVESAAGGRATVLVTDNGPEYDEEVTVSLDGKEVGSGKLYIHNPLSITGYAGTISGVNQKENTRVDPYTSVFQLKNTSFSANYDTLLRHRSDLEEELMQLLTIYRSGAVLAPMDGMITAVLYDEDGASASSSASTATTSSAASMYAVYAGYGAAAAPSAAAVTSTSDGTGTDLVNLYPDLAMTITISIDETDILSLQEEQEAEITVSSVSQEEIYPGTVTKISKVADTSTGVTQYSAQVTLEKAYGMLPGMTADVDIKIQGVEDALIIPVDALHQTRDTYYVYTSYDPETKQYGGMRDVTVGMRNDKEVEILSGLTEGEVIYYTEAPQNIFAAMAAMAGMGGMGGMPGGARRG
ncbi:MAG: HlyD family efflux transporter periplasmic adaptor subunit [Oscillospiraceae bacterium]|nr:HlyD family efflux transporter periplasmic adaptor subunit [Oscillospiraceae bacterium]